MQVKTYLQKILTLHLRINSADMIMWLLVEDDNDQNDLISPLKQVDTTIFR